MLSRLILLSSIAIFTWITVACSGGGNSTSSNSDSTSAQALQVSMSAIEYPTFGYPIKALVRANGDVLVSVSSSGGNNSLMSNAISGIQVFSLNQYGVLENPCAKQTPKIFQARNANAATQFFGMSSYPGFENSLGIAVEEDGVDFYTIPDVKTCNTIEPFFNVSQPTNNPAVYPPPPAPPNKAPPPSSSSFDMLFTKDGANAFVANEYADSIPTQGFIGVVGILKVSRNNLGEFKGTSVIANNPYIGVPNSGAIPGITLSQDGTRLYVTSEEASPSTDGSTLNQDPTNSKNATLTGKRCYGAYQEGQAPAWNGLLTIIDVQKAIAGLGQAAIIKTIAAGCSPVRVVEASNGKTIWLTARGDNAVLAFDVATLLSNNPNNALIGKAYSGGSAPVGLALFNNDQLLAVANSNRFTPNNAPNDPNITNVAVLDIRNPATASVVNIRSTGGLNAFPRNISVGADGTTLYVTNFNVGVLQVISTAIK
jgi:hypothetical protein